MNNYTFSIIKPDAVQKGFANEIISKICVGMFRIKGIRRLVLTKDRAELFYSIHKDKEFFNDLIEFMTSGPVYILALTGTNAVERFRKYIGDTDPGKANPNSIRALYGESIAKNAIHGADSDENAKREIAFFFPELISSM
jgi:nucleoside-diphosphate kinase